MDSSLVAALLSNILSSQGNQFSGSSDSSSSPSAHPFFGTDGAGGSYYQSSTPFWQPGNSSLTLMNDPVFPQAATPQEPTLYNWGSGIPGLIDPLAQYAPQPAPNPVPQQTSSFEIDPSTLATIILLKLLMDNGSKSQSVNNNSGGNANVGTNSGTINITNNNTTNNNNTTINNDGPNNTSISTTTSSIVSSSSGDSTSQSVNDNTGGNANVGTNNGTINITNNNITNNNNTTINNITPTPVLPPPPPPPAIYIPPPPPPPAVYIPPPPPPPAVYIPPSPPPPPLESPTDLAASPNPAGGGVKLTWNEATPYVNGYEVWVSHEPNSGFYGYRTTAENSIDVIAGTSEDPLYYEVRAEQGTARSGFSNVVETALSPTPPPPPPTAFTLSATSTPPALGVDPNSHVTLNWNEIPPDTAYFRIYEGAQNTAPVFYKVLQTTDPQNKTAKVPIIIPDCGVSFKIEALDSQGNVLKTSNAISVYPTPVPQ